MIQQTRTAGGRVDPKVSMLARVATTTVGSRADPLKSSPTRIASKCLRVFHVRFGVVSVQALRAARKLCVLKKSLHLQERDDPPQGVDLGGRAGVCRMSGGGRAGVCLVSDGRRAAARGVRPRRRVHVLPHGV